MQANARSETITESRLSPKQEKAVVALVSHPTIKEAAAQAGVNETTLWRWLQKEEFRAAYKEARRTAVQQAIARAQVNTSEAMKVLREVMEDKAQLGSTRVSAAKAVMDYAIKGVEMEDHEQRLKAIEAALAEKKQ